jgi:predicted nucleic acid-binding protein
VNLVDSGVLIALLDRDDPNHNRCLNATQLLPNQPMLTTWCCFTEVMYFLGKIDGHTAQRVNTDARDSNKIYATCIPFSKWKCG